MDRATYNKALELLREIETAIDSAIASVREEKAKQNKAA